MARKVCTWGRKKVNVLYWLENLEKGKEKRLKRGAAGFIREEDVFLRGRTLRAKKGEKKRRFRLERVHFEEKKRTLASK